MLQRVKEFIKRNNLIADKPIVCAVSGGADSVALIHILHRLGYDVILAHVNHNIREQSKLEQAEMEKYAKELKVPFELLDYHFDNSGNFQDKAHEARYAFFKMVCDKYHTNQIATAHHADDQVETVIMRILEGSNLFGYGGISMFGNVDGYRLIRPLLCVNKIEIYEYTKENGLVTFEDSSNHEDHYLRNRIRHYVSPILKENCPDLTQKINNYSVQVKESFDFIRNFSIEYLTKWNNRICVSEFNSLDIALRKDIISLLLENNNINRNYRIIEAILDILGDSFGTKELRLSGNFKFVRSYDFAYLEQANMVNYGIEVLNLWQSVKFGPYLFYFSKNAPQNNEKFIQLCYNNLELPLVIRSRRNTDTINLSIGNKRASRVLIDAKVPKNKRDSIPFIVDGKDRLLWIYDYKKAKCVSDSLGKGDLYLICEVVNNE